MKRVIYLVALVLVLTGSAMAQKSRVSNVSPTAGIDDPVIQMMFTANGIETTKGIYDELNEKCWGNTFSVKGGDGRMESYQFTMSMTYMGNQFDTTTKIVDGTWTLVVYKGDVYAGMLYGDITGGSLSWELNEKNNPIAKYAAGQLRVLGGTDNYEEIIEGSISGDFNLYSEVGPSKPHVKTGVRIGF